jgi:NarL family two-component system response regulator LiaR
MSIRVLLVEDHELVRSGIQTMLEKDPGVEVVGGAANGAEGVEMTRRFRPDIVLMDIQMPILNGIDATKQILRELPNTKVIMLTMHNAETHDLQALNAGAVGYVHKNTNPDDLLRAVHAVANGDPYLSPQSTRRVLSELQGAGNKGQSSAKSESLTEREIDLLRYLARGLSSKEMAGELSLSNARVRTLLSELYAKLGVNGKAQAAAYAVEKKLI